LGRATTITTLAGVSAGALADDDAATAAGESAGSRKPGMNALEEITVLGQRTTQQIAREAQFQAPNLIYVTTADEMQKLPDVNTGEARAARAGHFARNRCG
jgi:hypothetical protein